MAVVTLRMSRSNCPYGTKVLVRTINWGIEEDVAIKSHEMRHILFPLEYIEKVNFDL